METLLELGKKFPMAGEYLLTMYLIQRDYRHIANSRLADRLKVTRSAVSQAMKRLEALDLVGHADGHPVLTDRGRAFAVSLLRRHYLVEHLLVNLLDYPWDKADEEASLLQDKISADFTAFLYERLGHPEICPHGNPFPDIAGEGRLLGAGDLLQVAPGARVRILRITEEGEGIPGMLSFCFRHRIRPGLLVEVVEKNPREIRIRKVQEGNPFPVPGEYASFLRVEHL